MVIALRLVHDAPQSDVEPVTFADFWTLYPRRVARKAAAVAWARVPEALHVTVLESLCDWRRVWLARGDLHYVPHAATWLNGERWDDELPPGYTRPAAHAAPALHAVERRKAMPQHVRALLQQLRAGMR